jgi:hypothetical protein
MENNQENIHNVNFVKLLEDKDYFEEIQKDFNIKYSIIFNLEERLDYRKAWMKWTGDIRGKRNKVGDEDDFDDYPQPETFTTLMEKFFNLLRLR